LRPAYGERVHVTAYVEMHLENSEHERVSAPFAELPSLANVMLVVAAHPAEAQQLLSFAPHPVIEML
jgi:hypothetical protein